MSLGEETREIPSISPQSCSQFCFGKNYLFFITKQTYGCVTILKIFLIKYRLRKKILILLMLLKFVIFISMNMNVLFSYHIYLKKYLKIIIFMLNMILFTF